MKINSINNIIFEKRKSSPAVQIVKNQNNNREYNMIEKKTGNIVGTMSTSIRKDFMFIDELHIAKESRGKGFGTKFLDFARKLSKKMGYDGNLAVLAAPLEDSDFAPHIFYRKYGFTTKNKNVLEFIDYCIKNGLKMDKLFPPVYMNFIKKRI